MTPWKQRAAESPPSAVLELGGPVIYDKKMLALIAEGTLNLLKHYKAMPGQNGCTAKDANTFIADGYSHIRATVGDFLDMQVGLKDKLVSGQAMGIQRNAFGETIAEHNSAVAGEVAVIKLDAIVEPGTRVMTILYNGPDTPCPDGVCLEDETE